MKHTETNLSPDESDGIAGAVHGDFAVLKIHKDGWEKTPSLRIFPPSAEWLRKMGAECYRLADQLATPTEPRFAEIRATNGERDLTAAEHEEMAHLTFGPAAQQPGPVCRESVESAEADAEYARNTTGHCDPPF